MVKQLLIAIGMFVVILAQAQNNTIQEKKLINEVVDYVNTCNQYIIISHYHAKSYNLKINQLFIDPSLGNRDLFKLKDDWTLKKVFKIGALNNTFDRLMPVAPDNLKHLLSSFHNSFVHFIEINNALDNRNALKRDFFETESNLQKLYDELYLYQKNIQELDVLLTQIGSLCEETFQEQKLPEPLERSKGIVLTAKKIIQHTKAENTAAIKKDRSIIKNLFEARDVGLVLMNMESFGDFKYTDNRNTQERANIERTALELYKTSTKILSGNLTKAGGFKYGIRTYEPFLEEALHKRIFETELLGNWLNHRTSSSISIIYRYNKYIERAHSPMMKIVGEVLPFEVLRIKIKKSKDLEMEEKSSPAIQDSLNVIPEKYYTSLAGAKTNNLILLLDISSSMQRDDKLKKLKNSISYLIDLLRKEDALSVVVYSSSPKILFTPKDGFNKNKMKSIIAELRTQGGTNTKKGLIMAYDLCTELWVTNGNNRIIIATDGHFKIDRKDQKLIKKKAKKHISLSTLHFQSQNKKVEDATLKKMSKLGKGVYKVIIDEVEAVKAFVIEAKK